MKKKPKKIAINKVHEMYPSLMARGLDSERLELLVEWDVIGGIPKEDENECGFVFKEPLEFFIQYHNEFYQRRIDGTKENLAGLDKKHRTGSKEAKDNQ